MTNTISLLGEVDGATNTLAAAKNYDSLHHGYMWSTKFVKKQINSLIHRKYHHRSKHPMKWITESISSTQNIAHGTKDLDQISYLTSRSFKMPH